MLTEGKCFYENNNSNCQNLIYCDTLMLENLINFPFSVHLIISELLIAVIGDSATLNLFSEPVTRLHCNLLIMQQPAYYQGLFTSFSLISHQNESENCENGRFLCLVMNLSDIFSKYQAIEEFN